MPGTDLYAIPGFNDPFSSLSHLVGACVFAFLSVPLLRRGLRAKHLDGSRAGRGHLAALVIFSLSAVLLLTMSGVFHLLGAGTPARTLFQRLDHAAIFVLIAGTHTAVHGILFKGPLRWGMLVFVWTIAVTGVTLKSVYFQSTPEAVGIMVYLGMGWLGLVSIVLLGRRLGLRPVRALILGGIAYTIGAIVEWAAPTPLVAGVMRAHELFHIAVLVGLGFHWWFVWRTAALTAESVATKAPPQIVVRSRTATTHKAGAEL